jgi:hypothetical protein
MSEQIQRYYYENPLGTIAGYWGEPGPRFVDPYAATERKAIQEIEREADERLKKLKCQKL